MTDMPEELFVGHTKGTLDKTTTQYATGHVRFDATDTKYIRADIHKAELARRDELIEVMRKTLESVTFYQKGTAIEKDATEALKHYSEFKGYNNDTE